MFSGMLLFSPLNNCTKTGQIQWYQQYMPELKTSTCCNRDCVSGYSLVFCSCFYEANTKQWFSNLSVHQNPLEDLIKHRSLSSLLATKSSWFSLRWGLRICISCRLLGASAAPGPETKHWESQVWGNMWDEVSWSMLVREGNLGSLYFFLKFRSN